MVRSEVIYKCRDRECATKKRERIGRLKASEGKRFLSPSPLSLLIFKGLKRSGPKRGGTCKMSYTMGRHSLCLCLCLSKGQSASSAGQPSDVRVSSRDEDARGL